jgi:hypothetical protein
MFVSSHSNHFSAYFLVSVWTVYEHDVPFEVSDSSNQRWCFLQGTATDTRCADEEQSSSTGATLWKLSNCRGPCECTSLWNECRPCKHLTRIITYPVLRVGTSHHVWPAEHACVFAGESTRPLHWATISGILQPFHENHPIFRIDVYIHMTKRKVLFFGSNSEVVQNYDNVSGNWIRTLPSWSEACVKKVWCCATVVRSQNTGIQVQVRWSATIK